MAATDVLDREARGAEQRGDYAAAMRAWRAIDADGDAIMADVRGVGEQRGREASVVRDQSNILYRARLRIGWYYDAGKGVAQDPRAAAQWYIKAIQTEGTVDERDWAGPAAERPAFLYNSGRGVPRDVARARRSFTLMHNQVYLRMVDHGLLPGSLDDMTIAYRPSAKATMKRREDAQAQREAEAAARAWLANLPENLAASRERRRVQQQEQERRDSECFWISNRVLRGFHGC